MSASHKDYSHVPLAKKLGIKEGHSIAIVNEPGGFLDWFEIPDGVDVYERATKPLDVILYFTDEAASLDRRLPLFKRYLAPDGGFWVAYPKKSSAIETDLTFELVQRRGLEEGLVDNKSCAIDDDWSAVRFVYRLKDRPATR
ncbi:MAG TPA: DUF3052 domain-containing protein [Actinomycetota bacterium]|nr:DUF3052 domain-containing protein [Actinomycetota bacterium]